MRVDESILDVLIEIRDLLKAMVGVSPTPTPTPTPTPQVIEIPFLSAIEPTDFVYERRASTLEDPVPAGAKKYPLIEWTDPEKLGKPFYLVALGSDQHDNSYYHWIVDDRELPISGEARAGGIYDPLVLPRPIIVRRHIKLLIDNNNSVPYPNDGTEPSDPIPYEGVFIGFWGKP